MATIQKRGNSYRIKVSCGYDVRGKQIVQSKTWTPDEGMTKKQIQKELEKQKVLFEQECLKGNIISTIKFEDFAKRWFDEYATLRLKAQTIRGYHYLEPRIYKAIGHLRLDKITSRQIQKFILDMTQENRLDALGKQGKKLSPKTIKLHISLVSTIFDYALKMQLIQTNPCKNVTLPSPDNKERNVYTLEEAQHLLEIFESEDECNMKYVVFFTLAMYTGFRRGELLGLEWKDIDFNSKIIKIKRALYWTKEKGYYTDAPKTKSSLRTLKVPDEVLNLLEKYRTYQNNYKHSMGSKYIDEDRLFTRWNGGPMDLTAPYYYFKALCKRTGIRFVNIHSFRHLNASLLINSGVDVKTVQSCLGHSDVTTTLNIYAHTFQEAQAKAMDAVANAIGFKKTGDKDQTKTKFKEEQKEKPRNPFK